MASIRVVPVCMESMYGKFWIMIFFWTVWTAFWPVVVGGYDLIIWVSFNVSVMTKRGQFSNYFHQFRWMSQFVLFGMKKRNQFSWNHFGLNNNCAHNELSLSIFQFMKYYYFHNNLFVYLVVFFSRVLLLFHSTSFST